MEKWEPVFRKGHAPLKEKYVSDPTTAAIPAEARPRLPRGVRLVHNEAQGGWVLLAPERVFKADQIAAEIIKRCTGEATFGEIVDDLVTTLHGAARAYPRGRHHAVARAGGQEVPGAVTHRGIDRTHNVAQAARPPGRADAPLSARLPLLLEPARARRPRGRARHRDLATGLPRGGRARRTAGASLRRRAGRAP